MARISTYSNASPVTLSDKVIGTSVGATPANATKNFLVSDILALFEGQITLQDVLNAGNTATQDIILTGNITQSGGAVTLGGTVKDFNGSLGNNGETLVCNASGQLVFGSGLSNQNLDQVLAIGNTATNNINLTGDITQAGAYNYSSGQFTMAATGTMVLGGPLTCNSSISLTGTVKDYNDTLGTDGKILVSNASGQVTWQDNGNISKPVNNLGPFISSYQLALSDANGVVVATNSSPVTIDIPANSTTAIPIGTTVTIIQEGPGQVIVQGLSTVTLNASGGKKKSASLFAVMDLVKTQTNVWYLSGERVL